MVCAAYDKYTSLRFGLIVGASIIAVVGATTNIILMSIFINLSRVSEALTVVREMVTLVCRRRPNGTLRACTC